MRSNQHDSFLFPTPSILVLNSQHKVQLKTNILGFGRIPIGLDLGSSFLESIVFERGAARMAPIPLNLPACHSAFRHNTLNIQVLVLVLVSKSVKIDAMSLRSKSCQNGSDPTKSASMSLCFWT